MTLLQKLVNESAFTRSVASCSEGNSCQIGKMPNEGSLFNVGVYSADDYQDHWKMGKVTLIVKSLGSVTLGQTLRIMASFSYFNFFSFGTLSKILVKYSGHCLKNEKNLGLSLKMPLFSSFSG